MNTPSISRFVLALGGFIGFACAFFAALRAGAGIDGALMRGSIAMVVGALLMKVFLQVIYSSLREAKREKESKRKAADNEELNAGASVAAESR